MSANMADAGSLRSPALLPPRFETWFAARGWRPRPHQLATVEAAMSGRDALLIAPTGGGKTLAGFLPSLVELAETRRPTGARGVHTLYVSPLKALAVDVERNLSAPIREMGLDVRVETRTGDTPAAKRARQAAAPPDILLTTPEQIALFCGRPGAREWFSDLKRVVVDEIHAVRPSKRGDLLSLGLARLRSFAPGLNRIGLSATVDDPQVVLDWLVGRPPGSETGPAQLILSRSGAEPRIEVLIPDERIPWAGFTARHAMAEVYETIRRARTALVFVNTRFQAEIAFQALWELNEDDLPIALHHGSLAVEQRRKVEAAMARGDLRAVVCTSTLDLGIDWGAVDLVIQLAAPKGSSRLVQRVGRSNHRMDEPSRAVLVPANRFEVLECQAAAEAVREGALDGDPVRSGALDVLAQHVMGCACGEPFDADALYDEVRTAAPYAELSRTDFDDVVNFVSDGGYALKTYDRFRRIVKRRDGLWSVRDGRTAQRWRMNAGAIVENAMLTVRAATGRGRGGRKVGEIEEWFVESLTPGDTFLFGGEVWRLVGVEGQDAFVARAPGTDPKVPSWEGGKFPLSTYLAARVRRMIRDEPGWERLPGDVREWLEIQKLRSIIPDEGDLLVETFPRAGRWHLVAYPFEGRLAHSTLSMLLTRRLERAGLAPLGYARNDYALMVWAARPMGGVDMDALFDQDMLGDDLEAWLEESVLMKRSFGQCAVIAGLIERRTPGHEKSGRQVTFSTDLIFDVLRRHQPDHLLLRCARADSAAGLLDVARLGTLLERVKGRIRHLDLPRVSPFAVPVMLEIDKTPVAGQAHEAVLAQSAADLAAEALAPGDAA